jgi:hypothetical protein
MSEDYQTLLTAQEKATELLKVLTAIADAHSTPFWQAQRDAAQAISSKLNELVDHVDA